MEIWIIRCECELTCVSEFFKKEQSQSLIVRILSAGWPEQWYHRRRDQGGGHSEQSARILGFLNRRGA